MTTAVDIHWHEAVSACIAAANELDAAPSRAQRLQWNHAIGRVSAQNLSATSHLPGWNTSIMDGIALEYAPGRRRWSVRAESAAGHPNQTPPVAGTAVRISTGAVVPEGFDVVIAREDLNWHDGDEVSLRDEVRDVQRGQNIRPAGSDIECGTTAISLGQRIDPGAVALATALGYSSIWVQPRPKVAIISTGDELVAPGTTVNRGQIISTNGPMLAAQAEYAGAEVVRLSHAPDDLERTRELLELASTEADLVVTCGGVSVGDHDHVLAAIESLGYELSFRRVQIRPGRPVALATRSQAARLLALPGNPASSHVCFELFAVPLLRGLEGDRRPRAEHRWGQFRLATPAQHQPRRTHFVRARLDSGWARPLEHQLSGALTSLNDYDVLLEIPPARAVRAGDLVHGLRPPWSR